MTARKGDRTRSARAQKKTGQLGGDQIAAIASPLRLDLLQSFRPGEILSVAEIAKRMGKQKESLYYHVRKLVGAGVLVEADRRRRGRRYETLYRPVADRITVAVHLGAPVETQGSIRILRSSLRLAEREYIHAIKELFGQLEPGTFPAARRLRARLTDLEVAQVNRSLHAIERIMTKGKSSREGRFYSLTTVFVPVAEHGVPDPSS